MKVLNRDLISKYLTFLYRKKFFSVKTAGIFLASVVVPFITQFSVGEAEANHCGAWDFTCSPEHRSGAPIRLNVGEAKSVFGDTDMPSAIPTYSIRIVNDTQGPIPYVLDNVIFELQPGYGRNHTVRSNSTITYDDSYNNGSQPQSYHLAPGRHVFSSNGMSITLTHQ